jgi:hypothetical protein
MTHEDERRERLPMHDDSLVLDEELDDELRRTAARLDPVPEALLRAAEAAFLWRGIDAELAQLAFDSLADREGLAAVRGGAQPRLLTFHATDLTVELEILPPALEHSRLGGAGHRLVGQLLPGGPARVQVRHPAGVLEVEADELGRFAAEGVVAGPVSLRFQQAGDGGDVPIVTEWVPI